jgi:hypothetical protein
VVAAGVRGCLDLTWDPFDLVLCSRAIVISPLSIFQVGYEEKWSFFLRARK